MWVASVVVGVSGSREPGGRTTGCGGQNPVLAGQDAGKVLPRQAGLVPERAQTVAAGGIRLVADGVAQCGPGGVGPYRRRPVAQDAGEEAGLADGLGAAKAGGGLVGESGELAEGFGEFAERGEAAGAAVVGGVVEAGQPDPAVLDVHHRGVVEDAVPDVRAEQEDRGDPLVPRDVLQVRGLPAVHEGTARRLAGHPVDLAVVSGIGGDAPGAVPALVADQVTGQRAPVAGVHGMLTRVDGGRPGQRRRPVRAGLHGPPGSSVRLAGGGHPGPGGLLGRTIGGHGVIHSRRREPTLPGPVRSS